MYSKIIKFKKVLAKYISFIKSSQILFIFSQMPSVVVHNGDLKQSIDILRKKTQRDGTFKNYKNKERFEEPAQKRKRKGKEAMKRRQKEKQMKTFSNLA